MQEHFCTQALTVQIRASHHCAYIDGCALSVSRNCELDITHKVKKRGKNESKKPALILIALSCKVLQLSHSRLEGIKKKSLLTNSCYWPVLLSCWLIISLPSWYPGQTKHSFNMTQTHKIMNLVCEKSRVKFSYHFKGRILGLLPLLQLSAIATGLQIAIAWFTSSKRWLLNLNICVCRSTPEPCICNLGDLCPSCCGLQPPFSFGGTLCRGLLGSSCLWLDV